MSQSPGASQMAGPPYAPHTAQVGGRPTVDVDVPILAVLLACYMTGAAANMTIFQINRRRNHKFIPSAALFGFCMSRIVTCILRIAWATRPRNVRLAIASGVFVNAGILIIYILNLLFAQRILRARQPAIGWHPMIRIVLRTLYVLIAVALAMVITASVLSVYTLNRHTLSICRDILLAGITFLLVIATLPYVFLALAYHRSKSVDAEHFGHGKMHYKTIILLGSISLAVLIAGFKAGTAWMPARPVADPAWYQSKAAFYCFEFLPEILILSILIPTRMDKRFHIPDGSHRAGDYTRLATPTEKDSQMTRSSIETEASKV